MYEMDFIITSYVSFKATDFEKYRPSLHLFLINHSTFKKWHYYIFMLKYSSMSILLYK